MTSLQHLLPGPDETVRCADHSRRLLIDPGGTAIRADRVVLIETPLPWPKPVFDHPDLVAAAPILKASTLPTRTLAYVGQPADERRRVVTFDRDPVTGGAVERRFRLTPEALTDRLAPALATDDRATIDALAHHHSELLTPVVLVCTQGSHDVCCGSDGARFAAEAETIAGLTVYRVSHTGGHRFAPTAMTLPDGRMWADMDRQMLRAIISRTGDASEWVANCRGWWGADTGPAQVAERAVLERAGWSLDTQQRTIEVGDTIDGALLCVVTGGDGRKWQVTVAIGRDVPTIACRQLGGLPTKQSVEYAVRSLIER